jgi:ribonuclease H-related protein
MRKANHGKFYAVKCGRETGVFETWEACKKQTWGYPNGCFRGFPTREEAYIWLGDKKEVVHDGMCRIYTDGSHQREKGYLGVGAWCRWHDTEFWYSGQVTRQLLDSYGVPTESECSNPTAEFVAVVEILKKFQGRKLNVPLVIISDYVGVKNWTEGTWKAQEPHIRAILKTCQEVIKNIDGKVSFDWVKGHSGKDGNDKADQMAGSHEEIDTFADLIPLI